MKLPKELTTVTPFSKALAVILFITLPFFGFYLGLLYQKSLTVPSGRACTLESKICPDGSTVGRTGPNCEFAQCPTVAKPADNSCTENRDCPSGFSCIPDCGPPVARIDEPTPISHCKPEGFQRNCPICLSYSTRISTPRGSKIVTLIRLGDIVWSIDRNGKRVEESVIKISNTVVSSSHKMVHLVLADGRELFVSPGHPTVDGRTVDQLTVDQIYDGSKITSTKLVPYSGTRTYDILPAGETGYYWADGVLIGSTLK